MAERVGFDSQSPVSTPTDQVPRRALGRAQAEVSALGLGGHHLGDIRNLNDAVQLVREALDNGVTFLDN